MFEYLASAFPPENLFLAGLLVLLACLVIARGRYSPDGLFATAFGIVYVWLPLYLLFEIVADVIPPRGMRATLQGVGETTLILLLVTNKVSDSAAYLCGTFFGRHKMAPAISPKKTWEGAVAGLVFGTAAGVAVLKLMKPEAAAWAGAGVFSALLVVAGQFGDLVESALKRWAGVKDSGRLAPEFGGMLDMIDGFLVSIPVAYLFLWYEGGRWVFSGF